MKERYGFSQSEWENCLKVLEILKHNPLDNPDNKHFGALITKIHKQAKKHLKQAPNEAKKSEDTITVEHTTIVKNALANTTLFSHTDTNDHTPLYSKLNKARNCYCCNTPYDLVHQFYHRLCPECAELNYSYRNISPDLTNRKVILTGGRVKIGYATALKLLRCKAHLTVTTRFPGLALEQFQQERDYSSWQHRLEVYGLDLRNLSAVHEFIAQYHRKHNSLDILINNAAQTIKYDQAYYAPLLTKEQELLQHYKTTPQLTANTTPVLDEVKSLPVSFAQTSYPKTRFGQPVDFRDKNSWNSTLAEVSVPEVLEVNLINHISPYMLIKGFTPLLKASAHIEKLVVNVTSSEGQFSYNNKTMFHPHTNMTKAALNMLTRTSAQEYAQYNIFMSCVDVGWVSTGAKETLRQKQFNAGQIPPLDPVDGAARIIHPIYDAIVNKQFLFGHLLKNYKIEQW